MPYVRYVNWLSNHLINIIDECRYEDTVTKNKEIMGKCEGCSFLLLPCDFCHSLCVLFLLGCLNVTKG